jgi:hypothetical protein
MGAGRRRSRRHEVEPVGESERGDVVLEGGPYGWQVEAAAGQVGMAQGDLDWHATRASNSKLPLGARHSNPTSSRRAISPCRTSNGILLVAEDFGPTAPLR